MYRLLIQPLLDQNSREQTPNPSINAINAPINKPVTREQATITVRIRRCTTVGAAITSVPPRM